MIIQSVQPWFSIQEESNLNFKFCISKLRNYVYNAKLWILAVKKIDMHDIPVCASTQEQYGGPYVSSIVRRCKWSTGSRKIVEIEKFWYQGNVILCLCSQMQSLVLRYARKQNKKYFFSNLREFISIVERALDRVFKGLCFRRCQFKHDQLKINMKSMYSKTDA